MTSRRLWMQPPPYPNRAYQNKSLIYENTSDEHKFVTVRRSRKGMNLHIPEEFNKSLREQSSIAKFDILPRAGCCDMNYVLFKQNINSNKFVPHKGQTPCSCLSGYASSVMINIGSPPFNQKQLYQSYRRQKSYSTLSINPTVISEEPWIPKKNVIPTGLYCCGNKPICEHTQSLEQGVVNLDVSRRHLQVEDDKFVYITAPPKISPIKSFFNFFTCKKKKYQGEPYNPTIMTKNKIPLECIGCPSEKSSKRTLEIEKKHIKFGRSRISTITESDMTISQFSSEEFSPSIGSEQKTKGKNQDSKDDDKADTVTCSKDIKNTITEPSEVIWGSSSIGVNASSLHPEGEIHRWVCKPSGDHGKKDKQRYVCYLKK